MSSIIIRNTALSPHKRECYDAGMITRGFLVSMLIEFGPVVMFFAVTRASGLYAGTASLVATTVLALVWSRIRDNRVPVFSLISSSFVLVCGSATLIFMNPYWVVLEYTLYNALFGVVLLIGLVRGVPLLKPLFESMFHISDAGWKILSFRWAIFFILTALGNEFVWRVYGEYPWVHYRLFAALFLCVFGFSQFFLARAHRLPHASAWGLRL